MWTMAGEDESIACTICDKNINPFFSMKLHEIILPSTGKPGDGGSMQAIEASSLGEEVDGSGRCEV